MGCKYKKITAIKRKTTEETKKSSSKNWSIRFIFVKQNYVQEKRANNPDFIIRDEINSLFSINPNSIHTPIGAIERLRLAKAQASADLDKLLCLKTEQKKNPNVYFRLSLIIIVVTYLFQHLSLYKLVN